MFSKLTLLELKSRASFFLSSSNTGGIIKGSEDLEYFLEQR